MKDAKKIYKKGSSGEGEGKSRRRSKSRGRRSRKSRMKVGGQLALVSTSREGAAATATRVTADI